jgi:crotonobetainyl-CoA:carnitine CoA-transferase CaiB-like acyl-CoA transferase
MPLSDIRVIDLSQAVAGPVCSAFLADLGADVIKVERPAGDVYRIDRRRLNGAPFNPPFELYNRNKRAVCLDLKSDAGVELLYDLVDVADVVLQNWPPGVASRLDVDYETLSEINEDLIYVHVTGYGETGPSAGQPAMDAIIQHVSGFSSLLGFDGDPPIRSQSSLSDFYAGYNATISTLAAIRYRDNGGGGQRIDISLLESMMHNMDGAFEYHHNLGEELPRGGRNGFFQPDMLYGAAAAADGWVCVALLLYSERIWRGFCELLDRPDLYEDPAYASDAARVADAAHLSSMLEDWLADRPAAEAVDVLNRHGIPAARHHSVEGAASLDQVAARETFTEVAHPRYGRLTLTESPLHLSEVETRIRRPAPTLGQHNREVLEELGIPPGRIDNLVEDDVLVCQPSGGET